MFALLQIAVPMDPTLQLLLLLMAPVCIAACVVSLRSR